MKTYYSILRLRLQIGLQYRTAAWAGIATQFFFGIIQIMVFEAFYRHSAHTPPISLKELISYLWLQQAFLAFIMLWFRDNELFNLITSGNIAYELCRPAGIYGYWFARLLAQRLSSALLRCFPILLIAFCIPEPHRITLPPSGTSFVLFLAALLLGLLVLVAISMFIYISVFVTMSPAGSTLIFAVVGEFFSGIIIPIPLMPEWLQKVTGWLPFHLTADFPFRVYSGHIPPTEAAMGVLAQIIWLVLLVGTGMFALKKVLRRVVVQGG